MDCELDARHLGVGHLGQSGHDAVCSGFCPSSTGQQALVTGSGSDTHPLSEGIDVEMWATSGKRKRGRSELGALPTLEWIAENMQHNYPFNSSAANRCSMLAILFMCRK